jgi:hypothetical protein
MSDLSRLLGDVYQDETPADGVPADPVRPVVGAPATSFDGRLPEWADDEVLDKAFASWVPGPPADAPAAERTMLTDLAADRGEWIVPVEAPVPPPAPALADVPFHAEVQPAPVPFGGAAALAGWQRSHDDIIVGGGRRRRLFAR